MTITRVGSTEKYASGWEQAFGRAKKSKSDSMAPAQGKKSPADSNSGKSNTAPSGQKGSVKAKMVVKATAKTIAKTTAKSSKKSGTSKAARSKSR